MNPPSPVFVAVCLLGAAPLPSSLSPFAALWRKPQETSPTIAQIQANAQPMSRDRIRQWVIENASADYYSKTPGDATGNRLQGIPVAYGEKDGEVVVAGKAWNNVLALAKRDGNLYVRYSDDLTLVDSDAVNAGIPDWVSFCQALVKTGTVRRTEVSEKALGSNAYWWLRNNAARYLDAIDGKYFLRPLAANEIDHLQVALDAATHAPAISASAPVTAPRSAAARGLQAGATSSTTALPPSASPNVTAAAPQTDKVYMTTSRLFAILKPHELHLTGDWIVQLSGIQEALGNDFVRAKPLMLRRMRFTTRIFTKLSSGEGTAVNANDLLLADDSLLFGLDIGREFYFAQYMGNSGAFTKIRNAQIESYVIVHPRLVYDEPKYLDGIGPFESVFAQAEVDGRLYVMYKPAERIGAGLRLAELTKRQGIDVSAQSTDIAKLGERGTDIVRVLEAAEFLRRDSVAGTLRMDARVAMWDLDSGTPIRAAMQANIATVVGDNPEKTAAVIEILKASCRRQEVTLGHTFASLPPNALSALGVEVRPRGAAFVSYVKKLRAGQ